MTTLKRTPLFDAHVALGARMVPFAGFEMPVSYSGIIEEHTAVRERAGLFDVSHMGEFIVSGAGAWQAVNRIVTNDCNKLAPDGVLYTVLCRDDGTVVDDLLVTRLSDDRAFIVVNAANIEKDAANIRPQLRGDVAFEDASEATALLAVQGPRSRDVLKACPTFAAITAQLDSLAYYRYCRFTTVGGELIVSRTGYTGELGYEIFLPAQMAPEVWEEILACGAPHGITPVGLAARDTLRFEASFCLYGHELDDRTTPLEAGLSWVVKFRKGEFTGYDALLKESDVGSKKQLIGLALEGRNIARQGFTVRAGGESAGVVTSGTFSPTLQRSLCMAFVDAGRVEVDDFSIDIRNKTVPAIRVDFPFYRSRARVG